MLIFFTLKTSQTFIFCCLICVRCWDQPLRLDVAVGSAWVKLNRWTCCELKWARNRTMRILLSSNLFFFVLSDHCNPRAYTSWSTSRYSAFNWCLCVCVLVFLFHLPGLYPLLFRLLFSLTSIHRSCVSPSQFLPPATHSLWFLPGSINNSRL